MSTIFEYFSFNSIHANTLPHTQQRTRVLDTITRLPISVINVFKKQELPVTLIPDHVKQANIQIYRKDSTNEIDAIGVTDDCHHISSSSTSIPQLEWV